MKISTLLTETSTTSGSVAPVAVPFSAVQKREPKGSNLLKGIKTSGKYINSLHESFDYENMPSLHDDATTFFRKCSEQQLHQDSSKLVAHYLKQRGRGRLDDASMKTIYDALAEVQEEISEPVDEGFDEWNARELEKSHSRHPDGTGSMPSKTLAKLMRIPGFSKVSPAEQQRVAKAVDSYLARDMSFDQALVLAQKKGVAEGYLKEWPEPEQYDMVKKRKEQEQGPKKVTELSKNTLGSYSKKAADDAIAQGGRQLPPPHVMSNMSKRDQDVYRNQAAQAKHKKNNRIAGLERSGKRLNSNESEQVDELSKNTLGSYAKKANAQRSSEPDDRKADNRGTGVMKAVDRIAGKKAGPLKGKAVDARYKAATGAKDANASRDKFEKGVDKAVNEGGEGFNVGDTVTKTFDDGTTAVGKLTKQAKTKKGTVVYYFTPNEQMGSKYVGWSNVKDLQKQGVMENIPDVDHMPGAVLRGGEGMSKVCPHCNGNRFTWTNSEQGKTPKHPWINPNTATLKSKQIPCPSCDGGRKKVAEAEIQENDVVLAPGKGRQFKPGLLSKPEVSVNPTDSVKLDVPLLIRLLEFAREDAGSDMDLHDLAEKLVAGCSRGRTLTMKDYESLVPQQEVAEISDDLTKNYLKGAIHDTLTGKKDRNPGMKRAISRLAGTNKPLLSAPK